MQVTAPASGEQPTKLVDSDGLNNRIFIAILLLITLGSLMPRLIIGYSEPVSYDGYWGSFISLQKQSHEWWLDVRDSAHPPLFFLLQHFAMKLGGSWLALRTVVIACGTATTFVIGLIAAKIFENRIFALLCAASFGFAMSIVVLDTDVRPYPLALLLITLAFLPFVDFVRDPRGANAGKALLSFTGLTLVAQLSEHFSFFFYCACIGSVAVYAAGYRDFRKSVWAFIRRQTLAVLGTMTLPPALLWIVSVVQLKYVAAVQPHLAEYYLSSSGLKPWAYIRFNFARDLNSFLPLKINTLTEVSWIFAGIPILVYLMFARGNAAKRSLSNLPFLIFLLLLLELMIGGLINRYPFGGLPRQQSVIAPFLTLSGFALLDQFNSLAWRRRLTAPLAVLVALVIATGFRHNWRNHAAASAIFQPEYDAFRKEFPSSPVVFADYFSCFGLYAATHTWIWRVDRSVIASGSRIWVYQTQSPQGQDRLVLRDKDSWNLDFSQPDPYTVLADTLRQTKLPNLILFWVKQGGKLLTPADEQKQTAHFAELANSAGLVLERGHFNGSVGFFQFRLK
ncbi:MAG TPA: hypothetical protein VH325_18365 [Bryobacteraceae bacterium]|jgi:hypothetical protein|nr:hypothetical protein [Bryobacteraceae bacterium]